VGLTEIVASERDLNSDHAHPWSFGLDTWRGGRGRRVLCMVFATPCPDGPDDTAMLSRNRNVRRGNPL